MQTAAELITEFQRVERITFESNGNWFDARAELLDGAGNNIAQGQARAIICSVGQPIMLSIVLTTGELIEFAVREPHGEGQICFNVSAQLMNAEGF